MDTLINDKIEGKATLINAEPEIDYAFSDWMEELVNENMEVKNSLAHVERENDSGNIEASEKGITQEINSVIRPIEKASMANGRRDKERRKKEKEEGNGLGQTWWTGQGSVKYNSRNLYSHCPTQQSSRH